MVTRVLTAAHVAVKGCKPADALVIIVCFTALGLIAGFFIGMMVTP